MTARQFRADVSRWARAGEASLQALARQTCLEMAERVVVATPVDTGFLRGSWQPALGAPSDDPGQEDAAGAAALSKISLTVAGLTLGSTFYMTNGASYAKHVEYGTERMAGRHFVAGTVAQWRAVVAATAKDLRL